MATGKIAVHLSLHVIRRDSAIQVIALVRRTVFKPRAPGALHAMLRSDSRYLDWMQMLRARIANRNSRRPKVIPNSPVPPLSGCL